MQAGTPKHRMGGSAPMTRLGWRYVLLGLFMLAGFWAYFLLFVHIVEQNRFNGA